MSFKDFLIEVGAGAGGGATTAGAVAGFRGSLFGSKKKKKKTPLVRRKKGGPVGNVYSFKFFAEAADDRNFDPADVIAKLKTASKAAAKHSDDTTAFALEDENGAMVKIWVVDDQADDFQEALEAALSRSDEDEDDENDKLEIAEVLWKLRNDFDIVDVEWGEIPEDQEELTTAPAAGAEAGTTTPPGGEGAPAEGEGGAAPAEGEGGEGEMTADEPVEGEGGEASAMTALQQVLDMMKSDAEAKKAEAEAEIAKAQAEQAKYAAQAAEQKVKQEEEVLDMEAYYDAEKEQKQETERLAKLAKYRHQLAQDKGVGLGGTAAEPEVEIEPGAKAEIEVEPGAEAEIAPEEEETIRKPKRIHYSRYNQHDLGNMIIRALRGDE